MAGERELDVDDNVDVDDDEDVMVRGRMYMKMCLWL